MYCLCKPGRAHIPNATYQVPRSIAFWFQRIRYLEGFTIYGCGGHLGHVTRSTVSHFSYAPLFQGPHFLTKMLELNIRYDNLFIDILSV